MFATDIVQRAFRFIGVVRAGQTSGADQRADAFAILNQMIDGWNTERLYVQTITRSVFSTVGGTQTYTLGSGGNWNVARPAVLKSMGVIYAGTPAVEAPLQCMTDQDWANTAVKTVSTNYPTAYYDDKAFPLRNITLWPVPSVSGQVAAYYWSQLAQFDLITDYTFAPGYLDAIVMSLAEKLYPAYALDPQYKNVAPSYQFVTEQARDARMKIKTLNAPMDTLGVDPAIQQTPPLYNIFTDGNQFGRR